MCDFKPDSRTPETLEGLGGAPAAYHTAVPAAPIRTIVPRSPLQTTFLEIVPPRKMADPIDSAL